MFASLLLSQREGLEAAQIMGLFFKPLFGYNGNPALSEVIAYLGYFALLIVGWRYSLLKIAIPTKTW